MTKKRSWMSPFSTVLFCPPTSNSELAKTLRKIAEEETEGPQSGPGRGRAAAATAGELRLAAAGQ